MNNTVIIILSIILLALIILNHITIVKSDSNKQGTCSQTEFGCCPDGINSKIDYYGTNCPGFRPGPGYPLHSQDQSPSPGPGPKPPKPIGGCSGTRYGCCEDNVTSKYDNVGSNCSK